MFLLDAGADLGAFEKGRSSAPTLFRAVQEAAALQLAGDLVMQWVYTTYERNPADAPSRGLRQDDVPHRKRMSPRVNQPISKNHVPSPIGMTIISVIVFADMLLVCHHLKQPREVHQVVFQRVPRVPMCAGSVPWRRREIHLASSVLCTDCLTKKGPDQTSDTAVHRSRCYSMFVARVIQCVLLPWYVALTLTWSRGSHRDTNSEPRSRTLSSKAVNSALVILHT